MAIEIFGIGIFVDKAYRIQKRDEYKVYQGSQLASFVAPQNPFFDPQSYDHDLNDDYGPRPRLEVKCSIDGGKVQEQYVFADEGTNLEGVKVEIAEELAAQKDAANIWVKPLEITIHELSCSLPKEQGGSGLLQRTRLTGEQINKLVIPPLGSPLQMKTVYARYTIIANGRCVWRRKVGNETFWPGAKIDEIKKGFIEHALQEQKRAK